MRRERQDNAVVLGAGPQTDVHFDVPFHGPTWDRQRTHTGTSRLGSCGLRPLSANIRTRTDKLLL